MDNKITLSFDQEVIARAKAFAESQGISLSRLTEFLFDKITSNPQAYNSLEDIPVADFIHLLAEPNSTYKTAAKSKKSQRDEFYESKK
jgi:hypothetical protein